jgi:xanthine dehydrogenase small subunit
MVGWTDITEQQAKASQPRRSLKGSLLTMRNTLTFLLNGERTQVSGIDPTTTVLRWLRETKRLTGTKEGCAEGDCGACTVLVGHIESGRIRYRSINACIAFLPMLEGLSVITVEGVAGPGGALHPCQQAMVECHGSQCGFCTPGFVMSLYGEHLNRRNPTIEKPAQHVDDILAGNLCRCTGYAPIRAAASHMQTLATPAWDEARYGSTVLAALAAIQHNDEVEITGNGRTMRLVATEDQFAAYLEQHPDARIVSGATDVGLWVTKQGRDIARALHMRWSSSKVDRTVMQSDRLRGRSVWWTSAFASLADLPSRDPLGLTELLRRFAGPQVRHSGTIGGNIANASPIGDLAPALLAHGAVVHLRRGKIQREVPLDQFFVSAGKTVLEPGEFITGFHVEEPGQQVLFSVYKVSKRFDDDISAVCGAFFMTIADGKIATARIAYGGMAATPKRATAVEAALVGQPGNSATIEAALDAYDQDFSPITDMRASSSYRMTIAKNLLIRFYLEHTAPDTKLHLVGPRTAIGA